MKTRPSTALVVATVALVASLSGTAGAAITKLITGKQIKDGSIGLVDLSATAKTSLRGQQGQPGQPGPQGAAGAPGPAGPAGGFDPAKVVYVEGSGATATVGNRRTSVATCPQGTRVLGGGYNVSSFTGSYLVTESRARDSAGWYVTMYAELFSSSSVSFDAIAVCGAP
ncbi:MAG: hypothetical protein ABI948_06045 [Thermoleophilia bacterium]